jgi:hypothetical protein
VGDFWHCRELGRPAEAKTWFAIVPEDAERKGRSTKGKPGEVARRLHGPGKSGECGGDGRGGGVRGMWWSWRLDSKAVHQGYSKHGEVPVPLLDDCEKAWGRTRSRSPNRKGCRWISGCRWPEWRHRIETSTLRASDHRQAVTSGRVRPVAEGLVIGPAASAQGHPIPNLIGLAIGGNHRDTSLHPDRAADLPGRVLD